MVNLNTVEKIELQSSCKLTPKILKRMPFAIYDHMSFFVNDKFIFCGGHKRPGVVRIVQYFSWALKQFHCCINHCSHDKGCLTGVCCNRPVLTFRLIIPRKYHFE